VGGDKNRGMERMEEWRWKRREFEHILPSENCEKGYV
jgi:hypothetical protein